MQNGKVYQDGGTTGDQFNYGLVGVPSLDSTNAANPFSSVNYSLAPVPRDEANLEAEKGETVLTDMNNDGDFELYDIGGNRHHKGGTPLNLPPQSFIYSDTPKMRLDKYELAEMGINSKKKITPAKVSKGYQLNNFISLLDDEHSDHITRDTAEYMLTKNKKSLSQLAFLQEAKKRFEDGVPLAAYPYLQEKGINPLEFSQQMQNISAQEAEQQMMVQLPFENQLEILKMKAEMAMQQQQAAEQQQMAQSGMIPPSQGGTIGPEGEQTPQAMIPPQGMPPQGMMPPQAMSPQGPPPGMMPPQQPMQQPAMAKRGGQLSSLIKAQGGVESKGMKEFTAHAPIVDAEGRCFANCRQREYDPMHDFGLGFGMSAGMLDDEYTGSAKLTSGYTFNPSHGIGGLKGYIGGNIGGRMTSVNQGQDLNTIDPFANLVATLGYTGEIGDAHSYANYLRGRRGNPMQYGLGAYYTHPLMGDQSNTLGGYFNIGNLNLTGGYDIANQSPQFSIGLGIPIRKRGGNLPKAQYNINDNTYTAAADSTYVHLDKTTELENPIKEYIHGNSYEELKTAMNPQGLYLDPNMATNTGTIRSGTPDLSALAARNPLSNLILNVGHGFDSLGQYTGWWKGGGELPKAQAGNVGQFTEAVENADPSLYHNLISLTSNWSPESIVNSLYSKAKKTKDYVVDKITPNAYKVDGDSWNKDNKVTDKKTYQVKVIQYPYGYTGGSDGNKGAREMPPGHIEAFVVNPNGLPKKWKDDKYKTYVNRWVDTGNEEIVYNKEGDYEEGVRTVILELNEDQINNFMSTAQTFKPGEMQNIEGANLPTQFGAGHKDMYDLLTSNCADGVCWALGMDDDEGADWTYGVTAGPGGDYNTAGITDPTKVMDHLMDLDNAHSGTGEKMHAKDAAGTYEGFDWLTKLTADVVKGEKLGEERLRNIFRNDIGMDRATSNTMAAGLGNFTADELVQFLTNPATANLMNARAQGDDSWYEYIYPAMMGLGKIKENTTNFGGIGGTALNEFLIKEYTDFDISKEGFENIGNYWHDKATNLLDYINSRPNLDDWPEADPNAENWYDRPFNQVIGNLFDWKHGGQPLPKAQMSLNTDSIPSYNFNMDSIYTQPLDNLYVHQPLHLTDPNLLTSSYIHAPEIEVGNQGENNDPTQPNAEQLIEALQSENARLLDEYNKSYQSNLNQYNQVIQNMIPTIQQQHNMLNISGSIDPNKVKVWEEHINKGGPAPDSYDANYSQAYKNIYGEDPGYGDSDSDNSMTNIYNIDNQGQPNEGDPAPQGRPGYVLSTSPGISSDQPDTPGQAAGLPLDYTNRQNPYYVGSQWAFQVGGEEDDQYKEKTEADEELLKNRPGWWDENVWNPLGDYWNKSSWLDMLGDYTHYMYPTMGIYDYFFSPTYRDNINYIVDDMKDVSSRFKDKGVHPWEVFQHNWLESDAYKHWFGNTGTANPYNEEAKEEIDSTGAWRAGGELPMAQFGKSIEYQGKKYKLSKLDKMLKSGDPIKIKLANTILGRDTETDQEKIDKINVTREDVEGTSETFTGGTSGWSDRYMGDDMTDYRADRYRAYSDYAKTKGLTPLSEDEYHRLYAIYQKQNQYLKNNLTEEELNNPGWDRRYNYVPCTQGESGCKEIDGKWWKKDGTKQDANFMYNSYFADNEELPPLTQEQIQHVQAGYIGGQALVLNEDSYDDFMQSGVADQTTQFIGKDGTPITLNISPADGFYGNTTNRQYESQLKETPAVPCANAEAMEAECVKVGGTWTPYNAEDEANSCKCSKPITPPPTKTPPPETPDTPFWLQDELGLANALDTKMSLQKRYPWAPHYDQIQVDGVFDDPTREIAAIGEQATTASNAAAAFAGPKRGITAALAAQGKAATAIADTVNKVHSNNIKIANDINVKNAELEYKTQMLNNNELKQLYDNTVLTEENYDNALRKANANITTQLQNAYTNRANTANLNSIYQHFDIDPATGGFINITNRDEFYADPNYKDPKTSLEEYKTTIEELKKILPEDQWDRLPMYTMPNTSKRNTTYAQQNAPIITGGYQNTSGNPAANRGRETSRRRRILKKGGQLRNWFSPLKGY